MTAVPVLEIGGTHVSCAWVETRTWTVLRESRHRTAMNGQGSADELVDTMTACVRELGPLAGSALAVAIPGPFDYASGIARFTGVGKFDALDGLDLRHCLLTSLRHQPDGVVFVNDATAFGLGEWVSGEARGHRRCVALTLGTGVGSVFLDDGVVVASGPCVPPRGSVYLLSVDGRPLEDVVSRDALIRTYELDRAPADRASGVGNLDVRDIAARAGNGDVAAARCLGTAFSSLGAALSPWLQRFEAEVLVIGGGITGSWPVIAPALCEGLDRRATGCVPAVIRASDAEASTAVGAAWHARHG